MPDSPSDSISCVTREIQDFVEARDWHQFHSPKEMSVAISAEAAELMQHFVWKSSQESYDIATLKKESVTDEIADIAILIFEMADNLKIDLAEAVRAKLQRNQIRYPVDKAKGNNLKYNELDG